MVAMVINVFWLADKSSYQKPLGRFYYAIVEMFIRWYCTSLKFLVPIRNPRWLPLQDFCAIGPYGKMNNSFIRNNKMIEHKLYMNGHWMVPYKVGNFYVDLKSKKAANAGLWQSIDYYTIGKWINVFSLELKAWLNSNCTWFAYGHWMVPYKVGIFYMDWQYNICDQVCQWFSPGTPVHHHITELLLKVVLNIITLTL